MNKHILKNGLIYDGTGSAPLVGDVHLEGDKITYVGPSVEAEGEVYDATGLIVSPGLIDLHVHVYDGMNLHSVAPSDIGLKTGVTTMLDMGSAGYMNYGTFRKYVIEQAEETVLSLLNISHFGVQGHPQIPPFIGDLHDPLHFDVEAALRCIEANRDNIVGVKIRMTAALADDDEAKERAAMNAALEVRDRSGLPIYVHHIKSSVPLEELLSYFKAGDVLTHFYHGVGDGGFTGPDGAPGQALIDARERGVIMDVGHGVGAFSWHVAEPAILKHGFEPDCISTDLHKFNIETPVVDMATTMDKFLYLGLPLERVIKYSTSVPAKTLLQGDKLGTLAAGYQADVTLLRLLDEEVELLDSMGEKRVGHQKLVPVSVFKNGKYSVCGCVMRTG